MVFVVVFSCLFVFGFRFLFFSRHAETEVILPQRISKHSKLHFLRISKYAKVIFGSGFSQKVIFGPKGNLPYFEIRKGNLAYFEIRPFFLPAKMKGLPLKGPIS